MYAYPHTTCDQSPLGYIASPSVSGRSGGSQPNRENHANPTSKRSSQGLIIGHLLAAH